MSHLLDDDELDGHRNHRELTLSTGSVLGIFFGLALICALFFGLGYNMGRKSSQPAPLADTDTANPTPTANFNAFKPAPGSPAGSGGPIYPAPAPSDTPAVTIPPPVAAHTPAADAADTTPVEKPSTTPAPIALHPAVPTSAPASTPAAAPVTGSFVVQVAAISHPEDAGYLVSALRSKGYTVSSNLEADKLIHVQVGPFTNRKDADAMRLRLLSDGYNAMIK